ncbi:MAG: cysteine synthase A [Planctomycetota bacterium]|nr:MAG: cysteine synthase A [Planctomycetota bacterium]
MLSVTDLIGNTPMIRLKAVCRDCSENISAKAEHMNPGGSLKDRIALYILKKAEEEKTINKDSIILEVSSGNTGIAFSIIGVAMGYKVRIMLPKSVSVERRNMISCYGAECELIDSLLKIQEAVKLSEKMAEEDPRIFLPRQFANPFNPECHYNTTGVEILEQHPEKIDAFVMGVGTGGTLMGVGRRLREVYPDVKVIGVEPDESAVMSGRKPGCHGIQGFADGFIPEVVNMDEVDQVITVSTEDATKMARRLSHEEGLLVGISAGANVTAAMRVAGEMGPDAKIVTVLPDRGERYFSVWYDSEGRERVPDKAPWSCP